MTFKISKEDRSNEYFSSHSQIIRFKRFRKLGEGAFGTVYRHFFNKQRVTKVVRNDRGYRNFVYALSTMKKHNPHFPLIYSARDIQFANCRVLVVEMERLSSLHSNTKRFEGMEDRIVHLFNHAWNPNRKYVSRRYPELLANYDLLNAYRFLTKIYKRSSDFIGLDMHHGNVMFRESDERFVITDPFF